MRTIGDRLRELAGKKPNVAAIGKIAGRTRQAAGKWFRSGSITAKNLFALADHFNVEGRWLFDETGPRKRQQPDPALIELLDLWSRLDDAAKWKIIGVAEDRAAPTGENNLTRPKRA